MKKFMATTLVATVLVGSLGIMSVSAHPIRNYNNYSKISKSEAEGFYNLANVNSESFEKMLNYMDERGYDDMVQYMKDGDYSKMGSFMNNLTDDELKDMYEACNDYGNFGDKLGFDGRKGYGSCH